MLLLDPHGRPVDARFMLAAEWVGVAISVRAGAVLPLPISTGYDGVMRLSARNQLAGVVVEVHAGAVTTTVKVRLDGGSIVTSSITKEAADELGLAVDTPVTVVVKASDVMIAVE